MKLKFIQNTKYKLKNKKNCSKTDSNSNNSKGGHSILNPHGFELWGAPTICRRFWDPSSDDPVELARLLHLPEAQISNMTSWFCNRPDEMIDYATNWNFWVPGHRNDIGAYIKGNLEWCGNRIWGVDKRFGCSCVIDIKPLGSRILIARLE